MKTFNVLLKTNLVCLALYVKRLIVIISFTFIILRG